MVKKVSGGEGVWGERDSKKYFYYLKIILKNNNID